MSDYFSPDGNYIESEDDDDIHVACYDNSVHWKSQCVYDKDGCNWVPDWKIADYTKNFEGMESEKLKKIFTDLTNQLKAKHV